MINNLLGRRFCYDSRKVEKGCVFVAIKGSRFDGHDFAKEALKKGASFVVVERDLQLDNQIVVEDVIGFLLELACEYLKAKKVIGVTGSSGKTFTKEVLGKLFPGAFKTPGNMNTEIGIPISILNEYEEQRVAIVEYAMNKRGDIKRICRFIKPDVGIVLNVGRQHIGVAGSFENIFQGKMELFQCSGAAVYNADDEKMTEYVSALGKPRVSFGIKKGDISLLDWSYMEGKTRAKYLVFKKEKEVVLNDIFHRGHLLNIAAALAGAHILGERICWECLQYVRNMKGRFCWKDINGIKIVDDTYNASLAAFDMAVEVMLRVKARRRLAVVGPIFEQGEFSRETHEGVSRILEKLDGVFVLDGYEGSEYINPANVVSRVADKEALAEKVANYLKKGDVVLFKASRGVGMEEVLYRVEEMLG
ncbi:MAG: UDP-N-acetylmuramoyl-tripeptide--D-alanyl-D-alanine ligase [Thermotogaceae bacterium]|nr:UDP-N-acetylmuramoyl-tripeptide--D-alanyl-D-alanine ligase [Thermotogaceae bacterium]